MGNMVGGFVLERVAMLLCYVIVYTGMVQYHCSHPDRFRNGQTFHTGIFRGGNEMKTLSVYFIDAMNSAVCVL
jgi:hypothetical protein